MVYLNRLFNMTLGFAFLISVFGCYCLASGVVQPQEIIPSEEMVPSVDFYNSVVHEGAMREGEGLDGIQLLIAQFMGADKAMLSLRKIYEPRWRARGSIRSRDLAAYIMMEEKASSNYRRQILEFIISFANDAIASKRYLPESPVYGVLSDVIAYGPDLNYVAITSRLQKFALFHGYEETGKWINEETYKAYVAWAKEYIENQLRCLDDELPDIKLGLYLGGYVNLGEEQKIGFIKALCLQFKVAGISVHDFATSLLSCIESPLSCEISVSGHKLRIVSVVTAA